MIRTICLLLIPLLSGGGIFVFGQSVATHWEVYNEINSPLPNNTIRCLLVDHSDDLWIGTDNGLARLSNETWTVYNTANSDLGGNYVRALAVDDSNRIWIGTTLGGLQIFDGINWQSFTTTNSDIPDNYIKTISVDRKGTKWIGTAEGLSRYNDTNWVTWTTANSSLFTNNISSIGVGLDNEKYVGTINGGLVYIDSNEVITGNYYVLNSGVPDNSVLKVEVDSLGKPWYAGSAGGLFTDAGAQTWYAFNYGNSPMLTNSLTTMHLDDLNNFYLGTQMDGLMVRGYNQIWDFYSVANSGIPENYILALEKDGKKDVWIGTYSQGLVKLHEDFLEADEMPGLDVLQVYPNPVQQGEALYFSRNLYNTHLALYTLDGKLAFSQHATDGQNKLELPILESGYYMLRLEEGEDQKTFRLVIE